jgi:RNA polymerase sigma-70 factor, ECF subfamily
MQTAHDQLGTDIDLVHSAKQGDVAAFEELVRRHTKRVFSIARHITRSHEDAEEVSQETFLKACCHLKGFEEKAQFFTWLTRIAVNTALSRVRQSNLIKVGGDEELLWEPSCSADGVAAWRPNPEELYSRCQIRQRLRQALEELPQPYSTVFLLRDVHGLSIAETAAALQLSVPTVKTRLLRARLQLRESLGKSFNPTWTEDEHARSNLVARVRPRGPACGRMSDFEDRETCSEELPVATTRQ